LTCRGYGETGGIASLGGSSSGGKGISTDRHAKVVGGAYARSSLSHGVGAGSTRGCTVRNCGFSIGSCSTSERTSYLRSRFEVSIDCYSRLTARSVGILRNFNDSRSRGMSSRDPITCFDLAVCDGRRARRRLRVAGAIRWSLSCVA
jgi:hypothetical protein